jgi:hypothetical protein
MCLLIRIDRVSFLFTGYAAYRNLGRTKVLVVEGCPEPFGEKARFDRLQAIAYLS